ncbi:leucine-rich repeats (6 copies)-containing protein [Trichomonas vaginalis G3]|uniref:leucine-rich repeats (6 copies)-containing protein n=1 Tax=Trichomonas vaginalis (strain ATCC PRA-98 / G3) TaxID=412133 RepID=UPI0021E54BAC|nr:leucine-rich repeats (6 copies)-containing protein [Trichomonas vaginalis G3]KAI5493544.1 leucine-rich repeats (6 copies)-containing protein [Trichomonas vaginalis G3]
MHNLCYGGTVRSTGIYNVPRVFVSDNYARSIWNQVPRIIAIKDECDSSVPFENYAKYDYTYPKNPKYIQLPEQILPQEAKKCALIDDPYEIPKVEPEISPEENSQDQTVSQSSSQSGNSASSETNNSAQVTELINIDEIKPSQTKNTMLTYILLAVAAAEVLMVAGLIAFLIHKNREDSSEESFVEMSEHVITNLSTEITFTNPLFSMNTTIEDDPFASDFEEHANNDEDYFDNCLCDDE